MVCKCHGFVILNSVFCAVCVHVPVSVHHGMLTYSVCNVK